MKNSGSYEHVSTRYLHNGTTITVFATYRGTNSFGAVVTSTAVAEVDGNGSVTSIN